MALYDQLPVYKVAYDLLSLILDISPNMQRSFRYTIGERILNTAVDLLQNIYRANTVYDKSVPLTAARDNLISVRLFIRLAHDKKQISSKNYLIANDLIENVGKQLTSWSKSVAQNKGKNEQLTMNNEESVKKNEKKTIDLFE